jgi:hypothetical protein
MILKMRILTKKKFLFTPVFLFPVGFGKEDFRKTERNYG